MTGRDHPMVQTGPAGRRLPQSRRMAALAQGGSAAALVIALMGAPLGHEARAESVAAVTTDDQTLKQSPGSQQLAPGPVPDDVAALLPLLMTSPERKQFAADLKAAVALGRLDDAERQLKIAIETGTLAIVLSDRLNEPGLLTALETLNLTPDPGAAPSKTEARNGTDAGCTVAGAQPGPDIAELQTALEQEKAQSNAALRELSAATEELHKAQQARDAEASSSAAATAKAAELQAALQQERENADARRQDVEIELANLRQDYSALQARHEREVASQVSAAAEARGALARERERGEAAARELASLKEELGSLRASRDTDIGAKASRLSELEESLRRERERADAAMSDLAAARQEASERQARAAREAAASLAGLNDALAQERGRADAVTRELADAIDALLAARRVQAGGPAPLVFRLAADSAPLPIEAHDDAGRSVMAQPIQVAAVGTAAPGFNQSPPAMPETTGSRQVSIAAPVPDTTEDRLVRRADALFRSGDVSGARLLLERSMEAGNAQAAFLLAETFDPHVLSRLGALGIRPDPAKARDLYARALALGVRQAGERIQALK